MGDYRTTKGEPLPDSRAVRRRRRRRGALLAVALLGLVAAAGFAIRIKRHVLAGGYITSEAYAEVRPALIGKVMEIAAGSGARVAAGDVLVRLDDSEERAVLEEARSQTHKIVADLARREAELAEQRRQRDTTVAITRVKLDHATAKFQLLEDLHAKGLAAGRALEDQRLTREVTRTELEALLGADPSLPEKELAVLRHELAARQEAVARAEARLAARQVLAPISGRVLRYEFVVGEQVTPATVLYEVFGGERQILKLRVPERHATRVRAAQPYRAELTPYKRLRPVWFHGQVEQLRGVIQSESQRTYRVAYCSFEAGEHTVPPGTTAEARILVGRCSLWAWLFGIY